MLNRLSVIILGSGPAGCAAALRSAQYGFQTVLITGQKKKKSIDTILPCESVHPGIENLMALLKSDAINQASRGRYSAITFNGKQHLFGSDSDGIWHGRHIDKSRFVETLNCEVANVGTTMIEEKAIRIKKDKNRRVIGVTTESNRDFYADFIIDCTGRAHLGANSLRLQKKIYSAPMVCWTGITTNISPKIHTSLSTSFEFRENSWIWHAPENENQCSWTMLSSIQKADYLPPENFRSFETKKIITSNMQWRLYRPIVSPGIIICGDAAGIIDPAAGKGNFIAIYSGIMAIDTLNTFRKSPKLESIILTTYDDWFSKLYLHNAFRLKSIYQSYNLSLDFRM